MKYARLKTRIFVCDFPEKYRIEGAKDKDIIKQADTIEELCDEFVWREITFDKGKDYKGNDCLINQDREKDKHKITQEMIKEGIYGAIWTDKGLIYVAKMNEKGELELL